MDMDLNTKKTILCQVQGYKKSYNRKLINMIGRLAEYPVNRTRAHEAKILDSSPGPCKNFFLLNITIARAWEQT